MEEITVAAASIPNYIGEYDKSVSVMEQWSEKAREKNAELILFPELSLSGYIPASVARHIAISIPSEVTDRIVSIADKLSIKIACGIIEKEKNSIYCAHALIDKTGILGKQRKIHLPEKERGYWEPGDSIEVFDIGSAKVGISICGDSFVPEDPLFQGCGNCVDALFLLQCAKVKVSHRNSSWSSYASKQLDERIP